MLRLLSLALVLSLAASAQTAPPDSTRAADSTAALAAAPAADPFAQVLGEAVRGPFPPAPAPLAGVLWNAPDSAEAAVRDLLAMRRAGVRAVRTGLVPEAVLAAADRLGIDVAQELPIADLPASRLARTLPAAEALLAEALDRARAHPSARLFILARGVDTSDPATRPFFERLTELAHTRGAESTRTAYVTRFIDDDRASQAVDLVLLDARGADPLALLRRWRAQHDTPVGFGVWGEGVVPGREGGWLRPGTEARQARVIERTLDAFLTMEAPPEVAFLARWRDREERGVRAEVAGLYYGLLDASGAPRAALDVASGVFTGRQRVFAFDAGPPSRGRGSGLLVLLGWVLALGLGLLLVASPRLGGLVPQYFGRRDLYREAVQKGYGLSTAVTAGLAALLSLAVGLVGAAVFRALGATDALTVATAGWETNAQQRLFSLAGSPALLCALLAVAYGAWLLFNVVLVGLLAGNRRRMRSVQALSIVVWPRWPWLLLLLGAMLVASIPGTAAGPWAATLIVLALFVETVAAYRSLVDLMYVGAVPPLRALGFGFGVPFLVLLVAGIAFLVSAGAELTFLWHLAVRS